MGKFHSNPHRVMGRVKDKYKDKDTDKYKALQRPNVCYIFEEQGGFKDFKYDMDMDILDMDVMDMDLANTKTNTKTKTQTKTNTKCFKDPMHVIFLKSRGC